MENKMLNKSRENMYRFLSNLYLFEVDEEILGALQNMKFPTECPDEDMQEGCQTIAAYLKENQDNKDILDDLAVDYARIFLSAGVAQGKAAFPYESIYTSKQHLMKQESSSSVAALYLEKGLEPRADMYRVPEDHLGLLLEYMAELCERANDTEVCVEENDTEQKEFLMNHLMNWVPAFSQDMMKYASTGFYQGLAKMTKGFLSQERSLMKDR